MTQQGESTIEQQLLTHAERQTQALETIRAILFWLTGALASVLFIALITAYVLAIK